MRFKPIKVSGLVPLRSQLVGRNAFLMRSVWRGSLVRQEFLEVWFRKVRIVEWLRGGRDTVQERRNNSGDRHESRVWVCVAKLRAQRMPICVAKPPNGLPKLASGSAGCVNYGVSYDRPF